MAEAWQVSGSRVRILVHREGFPEPIAHVHGRPVWARVQVEEWRRRQLGDKD